MAIDFPTSPSDGDNFASGNVTYIYSEAKDVWFTQSNINTVNLNTSLIPEVDNLYFTNARVYANISPLLYTDEDTYANISPLLYTDEDAYANIIPIINVNANTFLLTALSDESTELTTGTKLKFRAPFAMTLYQIPRASLNTASSSGVVEVNIEDDGASIFSTNLTIDANETTSVSAATSAALSSTSIADDSEITMSIVSAGTGATGLKVTLYYRKS